jgi:hypothetical protein
MSNPIRDAMIGLAASPGILRPSLQRQVMSLHNVDVFEKHGIYPDEVTLMGEAWCIKLVNARRAVERAIQEACVRVTMYHAMPTLGRLQVTLPPLPRYYPRHVRPALHA